MFRLICLIPTKQKWRFLVPVIYMLGKPVVHSNFPEFCPHCEIARYDTGAALQRSQLTPLLANQIWSGVVSRQVKIQNQIKGHTRFFPFSIFISKINE